MKSKHIILIIPFLLLFFTAKGQRNEGAVRLMPEDIANLCEKYSGSIIVNIDEAKALLTNNPRISSEPFSFENWCYEPDKRLVSLYVAQLMEPERTAIRNILTDHYGEAFTCNTINEPPAIVIDLSDQLVKKALNAIEEYYTQPDKYIVLVNFALTAGKWNSMLGSPNAEQNNQKLFEACADMARNNLSTIKKKIIEEHDYTYFGYIVSVYNDLNIFEGVDLLQEMYADLENLFRFKMELEIGVYRNSYKENVSSVVKGEIPLIIDLERRKEKGANPLFRFSISYNGEGMVNGSGNAKLVHDDGTVSQAINITGEFIRKMKVNLSLCEYKGSFICSSPYLGITEKWEGDEAYVWTLEYQRFANMHYGILVDEQYGKGSVPIDFVFINQQEVLVDDQISIIKNTEESTLKVEVKYKISHDPK